MTDCASDSWEDAFRKVNAFSAGYLEPDTDTNNYPSVLCIGAQKAGTTWLYKNLIQHPLIYAPPIKEIHYFSSLYVRDTEYDNYSHRLKQARDGRHWWDTDGLSHPNRDKNIEILELLESRHLSDRWYSGLYRQLQPDQIGIDCSPSYSLLPRSGIKHVSRLCPRAKIIILLRDPAQRILSHAAMLAETYPENARPSLRDVLNSDSFYVMATYSDYSKWVLRWLGIYGPGDVLIEYLHNIHNHPYAVLKKICHFVGLQYHPGFFPLAYNKIFASKPTDEDYAGLLAETRTRIGSIYDQIETNLPGVAAELCNARD